MGFLSSVFGSRKPVDNSGPMSRLDSRASGGMTQQLVTSQSSTRRELLRVVLRDTLNRHGIPTAWVAAEILSTTSRGGERGVHWRLHIKHWEPRLLTHSVALQNALIRRVMAFDPLATNWLNGISWQFTLADESMCPPLPHPTSWTLQERPKAAAAPVSAGGGNNAAGDVIAGPVHIGDDRSAAGAATDFGGLLSVPAMPTRPQRKPASWDSTEPSNL